MGLKDLFHKTGSGDDIPQIFRFKVIVDNIGLFKCSKVNLGKINIEYYEHREGGLNVMTHRIPLRVVQSPITLEKVQIYDEQTLWAWMSSVFDLEYAIRTGNEWVDWLLQSLQPPFRRNFAIIELDKNAQERRMWTVYGAAVKQYTFPNYDAGNSGVALSTVELIHNGIEEQLL